jgi:pimeloyl-ACP methyl ester carboxylesterase
VRYLVAAIVALAVAGASPAAGPRLANPHPCAEAAGYTCSTLAVPLDRTGRVKGTLQLNVAVSDNKSTKRGLLLFLTGGPGQPGLPAVQRIALRLGAVMSDYRLVMFDQRGTGGTAIACPALQDQVGASDIARPTPAAVRDCVATLGRRSGLFPTRETVADMDLLRKALGVRSWTIDGVSYGTFVAARYALAHPTAVRALVLDSVLPFVDPQADDALYVTGLRAQARVLRLACKRIGCGFDPASDLSWLVRHGVDGVALFDAIVTSEFVDPSYTDMLAALHAARLGSRSDLTATIAQMKQAGTVPAELLSSGLHAATLCTDLRFPWGRTTAPAQRRRLLAARARKLTERDVWPYTKATATGNGFIATCLVWPATPAIASPPAGAKLPAVPTLLLAGDQDLSTPLEWAREELRLAPRGKLVVVHGASHSIQAREPGDEGRKAVEAFLLGVREERG